MSGETEAMHCRLFPVLCILMCNTAVVTAIPTTNPVTPNNENSPSLASTETTSAKISSIPVNSLFDADSTVSNEAVALDSSTGTTPATEYSTEYSTESVSTSSTLEVTTGNNVTLTSAIASSSSTSTIASSSSTSTIASSSSTSTIASSSSTSTIASSSSTSTIASSSEPTRTVASTPSTGTATPSSQSTLSPPNASDFDSPSSVNDVSDSPTVPILEKTTDTTAQANNTITDTEHSLTPGAITALGVVTAFLLVCLSAVAYILIRRKFRIMRYRRLMDVQLSEIDDESVI